MLSALVIDAGQRLQTKFCVVAFEVAEAGPSLLPFE